jgi:hypothetical protein
MTRLPALALVLVIGAATAPAGMRLSRRGGSTPNADFRRANRL